MRRPRLSDWFWAFAIMDAERDKKRAFHWPTPDPAHGHYKLDKVLKTVHEIPKGVYLDIMPARKDLGFQAGLTDGYCYLKRTGSKLRAIWWLIRYGNDC